ncbi:multidrug resistance protein [Sporolactobacillus inulinus]|uniref:Multidrug resistance protein n=1 Tax=Sporolactobacillus inulinus TaxID=2078 RepID=A0A4Y1ZIL8_9BACL|nr:multidrug resistance protein [Sporolactobacillus inulinus]
METLEEKKIQTHENLNVIPIVLILLSGGFVTILNQTLLVTALPSIMHDLNLTSVSVQWLQTVFLLVNGIMIPITAFLEGRFTTRKLFLFAMGSFTLGTLICLLGDNFLLLIIGRIVQAMGAGIMMPLMMTVMFIIFQLKTWIGDGDLWTRDRVCAGDRPDLVRLADQPLFMADFVLRRAAGGAA